MAELYNSFPKLPKNIRQIGERDEVVKLYVEDYVNTYLKRLYPAGGQDLRVGLLLGSLEVCDGTPYIFVDGALEMEDVSESGNKVSLSEKSWKTVHQNLDQLFPGRTVLGWFLCGRPGEDLSPLNYWKQHIQYFQGTNKLMYLGNGAEGDENIYITSEDGFYRLLGYSIYYERNQMMQDYMVLRKDVKRVEAATGDKVIEEFRKRMDEHKGEIMDRQQTGGLLRGMCMAMSVVILAGGIVMFNNYERMRNMESVIASAIPAKAEQLLMGKNGNVKEAGGESSVILEEVEGGISSVPTVHPESMAETEGQKDRLGAGSESGNGEEQAGGGSQSADGSGQSSGGGNQSADGSSQVAQGGGQSADGSSQVAQGGGQSAGGSTQSAGGSTQPAGESTQQPDSDPQPASADGQRIHIVQEGETLYGICLQEYHTLGRLKEICDLNGLLDENKIFSGQQLLLP